MFLKFINVEDTNQGDSILSCFNDVSALQDNHTCANRYYAALTILKSSLQAPASFAIIEASAAFRSQRYNPKGWAIDYINFLLQWLINQSTKSMATLSLAKAYGIILFQTSKQPM